MGGCLCVPTESGSSASRFVLPLSLRHFSSNCHTISDPQLSMNKRNIDSIFINVLSVLVLRSFCF